MFSLSSLAVGTNVRSGSKADTHGRMPKNGSTSQMTRVVLDTQMQSVLCMTDEVILRNESCCPRLRRASRASPLVCRIIGVGS